jgi:hypothetical protein
MKNLGFIAFITSFILIGCSWTEKNLELKGKVLDEYTKVAIPHREIIIQALLNNGNKVIPVYNGKFSTDSSGLFTYPLKKVKNVYLYNFCVVGDSAYAYSNIELGLAELNKYGKFLNFNLKKLTDLDIIIHSKGRTSVDDILYVSWVSDKISGKFLYPYKIINFGFTSPNKGLKWTGKDIISKIKTRVYADKETIVRWEVFRDRSRKVTMDTIFCKRDTPNYFELRY